MTTIADVQLIPTTYIEVYAATGIVSGTQLVVQNKSMGPVNVQNIGSQPLGTNLDGFIIEPLGLWRVPTGTARAWFKGNGALAVEVM
jgi:hypothetical protein